MSNNELRAQFRSSEGRAKQGFVSPVGEVDEQQLKELVAGSGVEPASHTTNIISYILGCSAECATGPVLCAPVTANQCAASLRTVEGYAHIC